MNTKKGSKKNKAAIEPLAVEGIESSPSSLEVGQAHVYADGVCVRRISKSAWAVETDFPQDFYRTLRAALLRLQSAFPKTRLRPAYGGVEEDEGENHEAFSLLRVRTTNLQTVGPIIETLRALLQLTGHQGNRLPAATAANDIVWEEMVLDQPTYTFREIDAFVYDHWGDTDWDGLIRADDIARAKRLTREQRLAMATRIAQSLAENLDSDDLALCYAPYAAQARCAWTDKDLREEYLDQFEDYDGDEDEEKEDEETTE